MMYKKGVPYVYLLTKEQIIPTPLFSSSSSSPSYSLQRRHSTFFYHQKNRNGRSGLFKRGGAKFKSKDKTVVCVCELAICESWRGSEMFERTGCDVT